MKNLAAIASMILLSKQVAVLDPNVIFLCHEKHERLRAQNSQPVNDKGMVISFLCLPFQILLSAMLTLAHYRP